MSSSIEKILFAELRLLSKEISEKEPFFKEISCLSKEYAELIAFCHIYMDFFPQDIEFNKFLDEVVIPALKKLGMVHWNRDILTEMGLKLGKTSKPYNLAKMIGREVYAENNENE